MIINIKEIMSSTFGLMRMLCIIEILLLIVISLFSTSAKVIINTRKSVVAITTGYLLMYIAVKLMM